MLEPEKTPKKGRPTKGSKKQKTEDSKKDDKDIEARIMNKKGNRHVGSCDSPTLNPIRKVAAMFGHVTPLH